MLLAHSGEGRSEVVNDINYDLMTFWRVLQDPEKFIQFQRWVEAIPLSRLEWEESRTVLSSDPPDPSDVSRAVAFFVFCRQSLSGRMKGFTSLTRTRLRRGMNGNVSEWIGAVDGLSAVHQRFRRVVVENRPALEVIQREDTPDTLHYCDPTYLPETVASMGNYAHEMTYKDHQEFLSVAKSCLGKVMISGYESDLYNNELHDWNAHYFDLPNNAAGGESKRRVVEVLYCNF